MNLCVAVQFSLFLVFVGLFVFVLSFLPSRQLSSPCVLVFNFSFVSLWELSPSLSLFLASFLNTDVIYSLYLGPKTVAPNSQSRVPGPEK